MIHANLFFFLINENNYLLSLDSVDITGRYRTKLVGNSLRNLKIHLHSLYYYAYVAYDDYSRAINSFIKKVSHNFLLP